MKVLPRHVFIATLLVGTPLFFVFLDWNMYIDMQNGGSVLNKGPWPIPARLGFSVLYTSVLGGLITAVVAVFGLLTSRNER